MHEDRPSVLRAYLARAGAPRELCLEVGHEAADVEVRLRDGDGPERAVGERRAAAFARRHVVRVDHRARLAAERDLDGRHEVEAQADEVDQVVAPQHLAAQVGVHEAQAAEAALGRSQTADVREH